MADAVRGVRPPPIRPQRGVLPSAVMAEDEDFAALFEASVKGGSETGRRLKAGQSVRGTVVAITGDTVFVDVGTRREARLARAELCDTKGELKVGVGDPITATVAQPEGVDAAILKVAFGGSMDVAELEVARDAGTPVEGEFTGAVKAGLEVDLGGRRAFCPASQVDLMYVADLETFVGQRHFFRVLEVRDGGRSVVVSRKALLQAQREDQARALLSGLDVGSELDGIVQSLQPYGAFVDLGGVQGLVHVSEIAHTRVSSPQDVLSVGERVRVKVTSIESRAEGSPRISLSMKALTQPEASSAIPDAEVVTATVVKVETYGVLVETPEGQGLVPTGEIDLPPGSDPRRAFKPGDTMDVVLQRREPSGRLRFSARAVTRVEEKKAFAAFRGDGKASGSLGSLGDLLRGVELSGGAKPKSRG
jgi:small subunit ribosomal protein S1